MGDCFEKSCRICLDTRSEHVSIFKDPLIPLQLKSCLMMTVAQNDILPKTICLTCVAQLSDFYNFQLNARCSTDWLESSIQEKSKKYLENKTNVVHPLPDSEYNSDSLLEFLNNTANIDDYLNNLGKEDIPCIVNMLDKNNESVTEANFKMQNNRNKIPSPNKKQALMSAMGCNISMEVDILDSDIDVVTEILKKEIPKTHKINIIPDTSKLTCFGCKNHYENVQKLSQHLAICDTALRTCIHCGNIFNSKQKMLLHRLTHNTSTLLCHCGIKCESKQKLMQHFKVCPLDFAASLSCSYKCKQCNEVFKDRFQLYRHAKQHIVKIDEKVCDICGHSFNGNEALLKHKKSIHDATEHSLYRCKICSKTSKDRKEIYMHIKEHMTDLEPVRHLCETCGKSFAKRTSLNRHALVHGPSKLWKCEVCNVEFPKDKDKEKHMKDHIIMVMCDKCGQSVNCWKLHDHACP